VSRIAGGCISGRGSLMSSPLGAGLLAKGCLGRRPCASGRGTIMDRDEGRVVCESYACTACDRIGRGGGNEWLWQGGFELSRSLVTWLVLDDAYFRDSVE
jgi:hypothetical protein